MAGEWVAAGSADLAKGSMRAVEVAGESVALYHLDDGSWHATGNLCTHGQALLTDGWLEGREVECPLHAGRFDVSTGVATCAPADAPVRAYRVAVEAGQVRILLD